MFKKKKKEFPIGTFIPTSKRALAIVQLCLTFSLMLWHGFQPFMGDYFSLRSNMLLYEYAMGTSPILQNQNGGLEKLKRNQTRFSFLPLVRQSTLTRDYQRLKNQASRSFIIKIKDGLYAMLVGVPSFELAWIVFASVIAIMLLLKIEGALQAAWLLPVLVIAYTVDNQLHGHADPFSDHSLFPSESTIIQHYLKEPLSVDWKEQQAQLKKGWENYLINQWSGQSRPETEASQDEKLEEGEFNFTLARIDKRSGGSHLNRPFLFHEKASRHLLFVYFLWNIFFAWKMNRKERLRTLTPQPL